MICRNRLYPTLILAVSVASMAFGQGVVVTEDFNYADGPLAQANPLWINHSGTDDTLLVANNEAVVSQDGGSEDLHRLFDNGLVCTDGVLTATFDIRVEAPNGIMDNSDDEYFIHFWQTADPFNFRARTFIHAPNDPMNDYTISISVQSSSVSTDLPVDFSFGDIVPVEISYNLDTGMASLSAGGAMVTDAAVSTTLGNENIDGISLRQSTNSNARHTIYVDNLSVNAVHVPEPAGAALLMIGLAGLVGRRRS